MISPFVTLFTPRGRGRGQLRNGGSRGKGRGTAKPIPGPIATPPKPDVSARPTPKKMSSTQTTAKNDPMWIDFDAEGFEGLVPYQATNTFAISNEGYIPLVERQYDILQTADKSFAKFISKTMFSWYAMEHLYARLIAIKSHESETTFQEEQLLAYIKAENYPIPMAIDEYLRSIGNTEDNATTKYKVRFPVWPNQNGDFERVGPLTHYKYETGLAPVILSQAIIEDLTYTRNPGHNRNWNLPEDLQPEEVDAGLPTKNLLGWNRSTTLTTEQRQTLEGAGVAEDDFGADNMQFQMNKGLFERIADFVRAADKSAKLSTQTSETVNGSVAQVQWQERDVHNPEDFSRTTSYLEREVRQCGPSQEDRRITIGALILALRTRKDQIGLRRSYACYDFGDYLNVPNAWHDTRNTIFEFGRVDVWNVRTYRSAFTGKDAIRTSWLRKGLLKTT